ncbi:uncharacterized protein LOC131932454 [Physella acuta]|uniref:uncharacterized protein LOC131932454 n=1 Tax=Physella acuta TaxID=109671 RepID=UPI0027DD5226|nr:uncharacterized protein LOC131932454 [Physella acuta]
MKMQLDYPRNPYKYKQLNVLLDMIPEPFPKPILGSNLTKWLLDFLLENEYKLNKFEAINFISKTEGLFSSLVNIFSIHREDLHKKIPLATSFVRSCKESSKIVIITDDQELTENFRTKENVEVLLKAEILESVIPKDKQLICDNTDQVKVCTEELKTVDEQEYLGILGFDFPFFDDEAEAECSNQIEC